jgi:hypothetical protein
MNKIGEYGFDRAFESSLFIELREQWIRNRFIMDTVLLRKPSLKELSAASFLSVVESDIPVDLICSQKLFEMKKLASCFTGAITSFFGFESHLNSSKPSADYLFAVSSMRREREALATLVKEQSLPKEFFKKKEWKNVCDFVLEWSNKDSVLYQNVLGMWFEFDMAENSSETPVPCIFLHTLPLRNTHLEKNGTLHWLTRQALPLVTGKSIPEKTEQNILHAVQNLPPNALVMDAGVMLSRPTSGVRLIIARIHPDQIIPYLRSMGWAEEKEDLSALIGELTQQVSRLVLHITITENGIDKKIGLECSFAPDQYHLETRWKSFLEYLVDKKLCFEEKKQALLEFVGIEQEDRQRDFATENYQPTVKMKGDDFSAALVRYISHVKLVYEPNKIVYAKAYPGVRLFGCEKAPSSDAM